MPPHSGDTGFGRGNCCRSPVATPCAPPINPVTTVQPPKPAQPVVSPTTPTVSVSPPSIPPGTTPESKALAQAATEMRELIQNLPKAKTKSDVLARNREIQERAKLLVNGGSASLPALEALLADSYPPVRLQAIETLGNLAKPGVIAPLCRVVTTSTLNAERNTALMWLAELPSKHQIPESDLIAQTQPTLLIALADPDLNVRKMAQQAQWSIAHRLEGYQADAPEPSRQAALSRGP